MSDVIEFKEHSRAPDATVIECLQHMLQQAEAGEVIGIAIGAVCHGRRTASTFVVGDGCTVADLYLGIERCKHRLLDYGGNE